MEGFYWEGGWSKKVIPERKGLFQASSHFLRGRGRLSYPLDYVIFLWGIERTLVPDYLSITSQKTADWPAVSTFLREVENNQIRFWASTWWLGLSAAILGLLFFTLLFVQVWGLRISTQSLPHLSQLHWNGQWIFLESIRPSKICKSGLLKCI